MKPFLFLCMAILATLGHGYFWVAIVNRIHGTAMPRKRLDGLTLACMVGFLVMPLWLAWDWRGVITYWNADWSRTATPASRYFQFCALWCTVTLVIKAFFSPQRNHPRTLLECKKTPVDTSAISDEQLYTAPRSQRLAKVPGNQVRELLVEHKRILVPSLQARHAGLKIAHVSDFHLTGRIGKPWLELAIDQINALEADVVALTGDIIESTKCEPWLVDTICRLQAPLGVYFIFGNHDILIDESRTREKLIEAGHTYLGGKWLETEWNGAPVLLAGNERPWLPDLPDLSSVPKVGPGDSSPFRLFLLHSPDQLSWARQHNADLVLAGHTHGGQLCFPLLGAVACPSIYGTRYTDGVYRMGNCVMHVTRGVSGRLPLRWLCPQEISLLELVGDEGMT